MSKINISWIWSGPAEIGVERGGCLGLLFAIIGIFIVLFILISLITVQLW